MKKLFISGVMLILFVSPSFAQENNFYIDTGFAHTTAHISSGNFFDDKDYSHAGPMIGLSYRYMDDFTFNVQFNYHSFEREYKFLYIDAPQGGSPIVKAKAEFTTLMLNGIYHPFTVLSRIKPYFIAGMGVIQSHWDNTREHKHGVNIGGGVQLDLFDWLDVYAQGQHTKLRNSGAWKFNSFNFGFNVNIH